MKLFRIAGFELRTRMRRLSTYVYFFVFAAIGFFFIAAAGGAIQGAVVDFGAGGKVYANSPYSLALIITLVGHFATVITATFAGRATQQDVEHRTTSFFFTAPISKVDYLGGRFVGALVATAFVYAGIAFGAWLAAHMPFLDAARVGPHVPFAYVQPYLVVVLPNVFMTAALFFALAALVKKMLPVYVSAVVLLLGYLVAGSLVRDIDNRALGAMLDPFGLTAMDRVTEYWTIAEKNTRFVPLSGLLLANRALWIGLGALVLALTFARFRFAHVAETARGRRGAIEAPAATPQELVAPPRASLDFSRAASLRLLVSLTRLQLRETVKSVFFLVIVLAGVIFVFTTGMQVGKLYGVSTYPVTYEVLELMGGTFGLFVLVVITFYSGELVWRERDASLAQIHDALPVPRWVVFLSKLLALVLVQVLLLAVVMLAGIVLQAARGYTHFEVALYAKELFGIRLASYAILCCLAFFLHVVINHKYAGHFAMIVYFVLAAALPLLGFEHHLYRFDSVPTWQYSAMNGFGHFVLPIAAFDAYWAALAIVLAILASLFWVRGMETRLGRRLREARARLSRTTLAGLAAATGAFVVLGAYCFWNTNRRNDYETSWQRAEGSARYERQYAKWGALPPPHVRAVTTNVDIFPEERRIALRGTLTLENPNEVELADVPVNVPHEAHVAKLAFGRGETKVVDDPKLGFYVYHLAQPLRPHERAVVEFDLGYDNPGFTNGEGNTDVVYNGTFFNSGYFPSFGYEDRRELGDDATRHKHGLAPKHLAEPDDPKGLARNYLCADGDFVDFDATVSTSLDQIALAPGYLEREWVENGRRHFHYRMDAPILDFYAFLSARYERLRDHWNDVAIEIDYHPGHTYDTERMVRSIKASLDYYTRAFSPYQHRQVRILEFPRYATFAQSFPNTIPYSEAIGFIAAVDDSKEDEIDYPFYVTAHEVAHQWWAHQVIGGNVQGSTMLSETLAQYSALMVMKHAYGELTMKKFLRYELDRYLSGRGNARRRETPLVRVENEPYVHYNKGSVVMYALQDYLGEETVNRALAGFLAKHAFKGPPYPNAEELVQDFRAVAAPEYAGVIADMFETITLYENRAVTAKARRRADGKWEVRVDARAKKLHADETGAETEAPLADWIDFGALDERGHVLAVERVKVDAAETSHVLVLDARPAKAGIDPMNKLVDRSPDDNVVKVEDE